MPQSATVQDRKTGRRHGDANVSTGRHLAAPQFTTTTYRTIRLLSLSAK